jgi:hypothetical protein
MSALIGLCLALAVATSYRDSLAVLPGADQPVRAERMSAQSKKRSNRCRSVHGVFDYWLNDPVSVGRIMRTRRTEYARFNVWTARGTWFWSLVYPDRDGGAIGVAASRTEAVGEAQSAIEQLPQLRCGTGTSLDSPTLTRAVQNSKDSPVYDDCDIDSANGVFSCSRASRKLSSKTSAVGESYNNLWQFTLQQYAARVVAAAQAYALETDGSSIH